MKVASGGRGHLTASGGEWWGGVGEECPRRCPSWGISLTLPLSTWLAHLPMPEALHRSHPDSISSQTHAPKRQPLMFHIYAADLQVCISHLDFSPKPQISWPMYVLAGLPRREAKMALGDFLGVMPMKDKSGCVIYSLLCNKLPHSYYGSRI